MVHIFFEIVSWGLNHSLDIICTFLCFSLLHLLHPLYLVFKRKKLLTCSFRLKFCSDESFFWSLISLRFWKLKLVKVILHQLIHFSFEFVWDSCKVVIVHFFVDLFLDVIYHLVVCFFRDLSHYQLLCLFIFFHNSVLNIFHLFRNRVYKLFKFIFLASDSLDIHVNFLFISFTCHKFLNMIEILSIWFLLNHLSELI